VDGPILANQNGEGSGSELCALRRGRGFEDALGISEQIRHEPLIDPSRRFLSYRERGAPLEA
jgi:hypothetical protein